MTHRDRAGDPSGQRAGRREAAGPAGHRHGFPTAAGDSPTAGSPARPGRRFPKAFGRRPAWLAMPRIARGFPPTRPLARRIACPISMSHYQRSLVSDRQPSQAGSGLSDNAAARTEPNNSRKFGLIRDALSRAAAAGEGLWGGPGAGCPRATDRREEWAAPAVAHGARPAR